MCLMCEGYTEEQMIEAWAEQVRTDGSMTLGVDAGLGWVYTIGLRWNFDHPELIVTHPDIDKGADLVRHAVDEIRAGRRFGISDRWTTSCGIPASFGPVHHANLGREWFARWPQIATACGQATTSLRALQVFVVSCGCVGCEAQLPLDRPRRPGSPAPRSRRRSSDRRRHR